ncbi:MAG: DUF3298 and DUF4163 domain-containing protein [Christensenellales bacterium]|jgi:hypothetical protein
MQFDKVEIVPKNNTENYTFKNNIVLNSEIKAFRVKHANKFTEFLINKDLVLQEKNFLLNVKKLYSQSVKAFLDSLKQGYPFNAYEAFLSYEVSLNQDCYFSYFYDTYTFTGGAHGNTIRKAKTYSLKTGRALSLQYFFKRGAGFARFVLELILAQAQENFEKDPYIYFEDYKNLIVKNFNGENFYLTPEGIVIFFNQYEIAHYVPGMPKFLIPYSKTDFVLSC